jgi:adenine deaminase
VILTSDLETLPIEHVIARGVTIAKGGECLVDCPHYDWPDHARQTVHMGPSRNADDFVISAAEGANSVTANVIGVVENQAPTKALTARLNVANGRVQMDQDKDVCQIALVERHRATGTTTNAFVSGFGYSGKMAMASTVAHDSHHMIVVGTDHENMALAANRLGEVGGGVTVFKDGQEIALVELPIAGLMSDEPAKTGSDKAQKLVEAMQACGCTLNNAYMQHSLLALVVIPELRISDLGLVDVTKFEMTDVIQATE